jgi:hypothetical protein
MGSAAMNYQAGYTQQPQRQYQQQQQQQQQQRNNVDLYEWDGKIRRGVYK